MADGTGLDRFQKVFPERFYDVGIAEQHAVTFAAGLAAEGMKPVPAIYSTFLQRAYDQVVHDVCLQNLDVTFALDRAGLVGADGATHQGVYDFAYLRTLPNLVVMAPKDENELQHMLRTAIEHPGPAAVRFPRGDGFGVPLDPELQGAADRRGRAAARRRRRGRRRDRHAGAPGARSRGRARAPQGISVAVLNARFVKPLDATRIVALARRCRALVTVEEHSGMGGFGAAVLEALAAAGVARAGALPRAARSPDRARRSRTRRRPRSASTPTGIAPRRAEPARRDRC